MERNKIKNTCMNLHRISYICFTVGSSHIVALLLLTLNCLHELSSISNKLILNDIKYILLHLEISLNNKSEK
jgi:hypothetical protein